MALAHMLSSTEAVFRPPSLPTCSQLAGLRRENGWPARRPRCRCRTGRRRGNELKSLTTSGIRDCLAEQQRPAGQPPLTSLEADVDRVPRVARCVRNRPRVTRPFGVSVR